MTTSHDRLKFNQQETIKIKYVGILKVVTIFVGVLKSDLTHILSISVTDFYRTFSLEKVKYVNFC